MSKGVTRIRIEKSRTHTWFAHVIRSFSLTDGASRYLTLTWLGTELDSPNALPPTEMVALYEPAPFCSCMKLIKAMRESVSCS